MRSFRGTLTTVLEQNLKSVLENRFKLTSFRKGQLDILLSVIGKRKDTLAVMPTGGGKSLCYQIPALYSEGFVIVVSPLIALMKDQVRTLKHLGISCGCLHSGQTPAEKQQVFIEMSQAKSFILYLSPERVQNPGFATWIKTQKVSLFAIDEAHCVSQWGPEFRQDYHRLSLLRELRPDVPILALTATATPMVLGDVAHQLKLVNPDRHVYGFYRPNLFYQVEICESSQRKDLMVREALLSTPEGRIIIYCGTRSQTEDIKKSFKKEFPGLDYYHAGLDQDERNQIQKDFEDGKTRILAATNAFGMGIDHPDVRLVVHYQMPANIETFYQEMGRAGRDGKESTCLLLYSKKDKGLHSFFIQQSAKNKDTPQDEHYIRLRWRGLDNIVQFAEGGECRHAGILTYFRDTNRIQACGHCDICAPESLRRIQRPTFIPEIKVKTKKERPSKDLDETPLSVEELVRAEKLKAWRKEYAGERDMPAFMIFSNKTLHDLAKKNPIKLKDLQKIYGLGPHKIEHYGELILAELAKV